MNKSILRLFLTGYFMGLADLIPGVSGGTVAFISGIYEELLISIKKVSGEVIRLFLAGKIKEAFKEIPFRFLLPLGIGLLAAIVTLSRLLSFLLKTYPEFVWSLFFGLVLASTWLVAKRIKKWNFSYAIAFATTAAAAYFIVNAVPVETPSTLPAFFLSGAVAIIAMILPGISGSFILLLMGKYEQVLEAAKNLDIIVLLTVLAGAVVGLSIFSRLLTWLFSKYHDISVAILAGFMFGSVRKLWPWKEVVLTHINSHGEIVPIVENNILPLQPDLNTIIAIILMIIGVCIVIYLDKLKLVEEKPKKTAGFSLIELLVVVGLVSTLAFISISTYFSAARDGRNAKRKSDLKQLQIALEQFKKTNNNYPQTFTGSPPATADFWGDCDDLGNHGVTGADGYIPDLAPDFVTTLPLDPRNGIANTQNDSHCVSTRACYIYASNGDDYKLIAHCTPEGLIDSIDSFVDPARPAYSYAVWSSSRSTNW